MPFSTRWILCAFLFSCSLHSETQTELLPLADSSIIKPLLHPLYFLLKTQQENFRENSKRQIEICHPSPDFSYSQLAIFANNILTLHEKELPDCILASSDEFIIGITLIAGGLLLIRYPPPIRTLGIYMIKAGIASIGWDYASDVIHYLRDKGIIDQQGQQNLEEVLSLG